MLKLLLTKDQDYFNIIDERLTDSKTIYIKDEELYLYYIEEISNFTELYSIIFDLEQNWYDHNFYYVSS